MTGEHTHPDLEERLAALEQGEPVPPDPSSTTVRSIEELLEASADDTYGEVILADGPYEIAPARSLDPKRSLWYGGPRGGHDLARRTTPVRIRPESPWGATLVGNGGSGPWLSIMEDAHLFRFEQLTFDYCPVDRDGIVKIGGDAGYAPAHHVELAETRILETCRGSCAGPDSPATEHAIYLAHAAGDGPHDITIEDADLDCRGGLAAGVHVYHSAPGAPGPHHITIARTRIRGAQQSVMIWDRTVHDLELEAIESVDAMRWDLSYVNDTSGDGATEGTPYGIVVRGSHGSGVHAPGYHGGLYAPSGTEGLVDGGGNGAVLELDRRHRTAPPQA